MYKQRIDLSFKISTLNAALTVSYGTHGSLEGNQRFFEEKESDSQRSNALNASQKHSGGGGLLRLSHRELFSP